MSWFDKAFSITTLSLWINPYWAGFWLIVHAMLAMQIEIRKAA